MAKTYRKNIDGSELLGRDLTPLEVDANFRDSDARESAAITAAANAVNKVLTAASDAAMIALTANKGDLCKRTDGADPRRVYQLNDVDATILGNWILVGLYTLSYNYEIITNKNAANGYCGLDGTGKVAAAQLPSYVDDVLEVANYAALPVTGETGKIYVTLDTNFEYRWTGTAYIQIVASPGTTDALAEGTTNKYFTAARVLAAVLTGIGFSDATAVAATDTILQGFGKLQAQLSGLTTATITDTIGKRFQTDAQRTANDATSSIQTQINSKQASLGFTAENSVNKNAANGYCGLDGTGKVASAQLPSYVDDVLEVANYAALPVTGETGKIYVTLDTNKEYRWSGTVYIQITNGVIGSTTDVPEGTNLYFTAARVLAAVLTGLSTATNAVITAADTVLSALGKLQKQITDLTTTTASYQTYPLTTGTGATLTGTADYNTLTNSGFFAVSNSGAMANKPAGDVASAAGIVQVIVGPVGMIAQYLILAAGTKFSRAYNGTIWSAWA